MTSPQPARVGRLVKALVTWFGAGLLPKAPGTWGSLAALPFAWGLQWIGGAVVLAVAAAVLFVLGWRVADAYTSATGRRDPPEVVVDEVVGQWVTLLAAGQNPILYAVGFVLFRVADIWKPWPVRWADRAVPGGLGIMLDDVLAGGYAFGVLALAALVGGGDGVL